MLDILARAKAGTVISACSTTEVKIKQFVVEIFFLEEEDGGLASFCLIEHEVAFMRCRGATVLDAQDLHLG